MKKFLLLCLLTFNFQFLTFNSNASTTVAGGNVSGTWTLAGSPYNVQGNILILDATTLTILPGVTVNFQGTFKLNVQGRLLAIGNATDTIIFIAATPGTGWRGIRFDNTPSTNDTSKIVYCKLLYGKATGSSPNDNGGALYFNNFSKAFISNSRISNCSANVAGGGIYSNGSSPTISKNTISYNTCADQFYGGGGIYCLGGNPAILKNFISNNNSTGCSGGGIYCNHSIATISDNTISDNIAISGSGVGGGIYCSLSGTNSVISNNIISNNSARIGGGIYCENATIINNTISGNSADLGGGGIYCDLSGTNSVISNNTISYNTVNFDTGDGGGGIFCSGAATITNNVITNNSAPNSNGAGICCKGNATITNNAIALNYTGFMGGGIYCLNSNPGISNNIIVNNGASSGGGIYCTHSSPTITNTTIANNGTTWGGGLFCTNTSNPTFSNSILWGNAANTGGMQVYLDDEASDPNFYFCDVQDSTADFELYGNSYTGIYQTNIYTDPLFVSPTSGSGTDYNWVGTDWSLQSISPCINTGDPIGTYPSADIAANTRVTVCRIDMGAYEYQNGIPFTATISQNQQILCYGDSTATATIVANGGSGNYTYTWNTVPIQTGPTAIGLKAAAYAVTVTESSYGCSLTETITISQPQQIIFTSVPNNVLCKNGNTGSITDINANGGNGVFQYSKNGGLTYQSANIFGGLVAATYQVVVKDANNCVTSVQSVIITEPPLLSFTTKHGNVLCKNGNSGNDTVNAIGGTGTIQYSKDGGLTYQLSNIFSELSANTYQITVKDSNNCVAPVQNVIISEPALLSFNTNTGNLLCNNDNSGRDTVHASGGSGTFQYSNDGGNTFQSSNIFTGLSASPYQIVIKDANNCITLAQSDVLSQPDALLLTPSHVDVLCFGQHNGSAAANASGGTSPYSYLWNSTPAQSTDTAKILSAGTYTIAVTDTHNCTKSTSVIISEPVALSLNPSKTNASCNNNDGIASVTANGGTSPYSYLWSNNSHNQNLSGIGSGIYYVAVADSNGCAISDSITIDNSIAQSSIPICMVTVDSSSTKNVIVWEKPSNAPIDSFRIYREIASVYSLIGSVSYTDLSEFTDYTNGVNPNTTSYKYKLSVLDTCGNESPLSTFHQTVHVQIGVAFPQGVNLSWNDYVGYTFSQYRILRDNLGNNNWQVLDSVSYGITTYTSTDILPNARYIIEATRPSPCVSTRQSSNTRNSSKSNTASQSTTGMDELSNDVSVMVYPNPTNGKFTILMDDGKWITDNGKLSIYNLLGEQIYLSELKRQIPNEIDLSKAPNGIYFVTIYEGDKVYSRKIVKQ